MRLRLLYLFVTILLNCNSFSQHIHPTISFDHSGLCYGGFTFFINTTTTHAPITYTWTIYRNGITTPIFTSNAINITFQFPAKDTYTLQLEADNGGGHSHYLIKEFKIDSLIHPDFNYEDCDSKFFNYSTCATNYYWDFGDGNTSTAKNPSHYYTNTGAYNVKLKVSNSVSSDSIVKSIFAYPKIVTGKFTYKYIGDSVSFTAADTTLGGLIEYNWSFGDGTVKQIFGINGAKIKHKYPEVKKDSIYSAFLLVKVYCHNAFSQQNILITDSTLADKTLVFPNPSSHLIYIETERKTELTDIKLFDVLGQEIKGLNAIENLRGFNIDIRNLAKATYILRLYYGKDDVKTYKMIVN